MSQGNSNGFVRVMRSHDYNQFEVCLPLPHPQGFDTLPVPITVVDDLRKAAARLVDKAVAQYDQMKAAQLLADRMREDDGLVSDQEAVHAMTIPEDRRTPSQKAAIRLVKQREWLANKGRYDYDDEAPEF